MYSKASFVFWTTLALYIFTLLTVSYVGVKLTYIAIPFIVIFGLIMMITKPKNTEDTSEISKKNVKEPSEIREAATGLITSVLDEVVSVCHTVDEYCDKQAYINIVVGPLKEKLDKLNDQKSKINFTYTTDSPRGGDEYLAASLKEFELRKPIQLKIDELKREIAKVKEQRALEYEEKYPSIQE